MVRKMDNEKVSYIVFESEMARHERTISRLIKALVVAVMLIFVSNIAWLWFFNQFDIEGEAVQLESHEEGNASYMGGSGVIDNGRGKSNDD